MGSQTRSGVPGRAAAPTPPPNLSPQHRTPPQGVLRGVFLRARFAFVLALWMLPATAFAQMAAAGQWLTADGEARVDTFDCQGTLCGRIVWLRRPVDDDGRVRRDIANEDEELRIRPILGLQVLTGFTADGTDRWSGGIVYVPEAGRAYRASVSLEGPSTLVVRRFRWLPWLGWLPGLSQAERWTRVAP